MVKVGGVGVPTIKPWNNEAVFEKLDILNEQGIFAAAMDIDGAGLPFLKAMNPNAGSFSLFFNRAKRIILSSGSEIVK